jgi:hypothetical protein
MVCVLVPLLLKRKVGVLRGPCSDAPIFSSLGFCAQVPQNTAKEETTRLHNNAESVPQNTAQKKTTRLHNYAESVPENTAQKETTRLHNNTES